jgi:hypothetical protein
MSLGASEGGRSVALGAVLRVHPDTALQKVAGRWMAATLDDMLHTFEEPAGAVSEVGERIIELVDGKRTVADIVTVVVEEFEVSREECEADTLAFVGVLVEKKVLVAG